MSSAVNVKDLSIDQLRSKLQPFLDSSRNKPFFTNWAQAIECHPRAIYRPQTEEQIQMLVELCRREGVELRAFGSGHSPSDLVCTEGYLVSLDALDQIVSVDLPNKTMTVQGGMHIQQIIDNGKQHGLAMSNLGSITEQSIAGAISTATHGAALKINNYSGFVRELTIVLADSSIVTCSNQENSDLYKASLCGLGTTGIIVRVKLQLESLYKLREEMFGMSFDDFVDAIDAREDASGESGILGSAEHVRAWYFPWNSHVKVSQCNRTTEPTTPEPSFFENWYRQWFIAGYFHQFMLFLALYARPLLKWHERFYWNETFSPHRPHSDHLLVQSAQEKKRHYKQYGQSVYKVQVYDKIFCYDCGPRQYTFEGCVPISKLQDTLLDINSWLQKEAKDPNGLIFHFPIEVRPTEKDDIWLSPCYGQRMCYIGIQIYKPFSKVAIPYTELFKRFENIITDNDGRPHWAKAHTRTKAQLEQMYPRMKDFVALRNKVDPSGIFLSPYIKRHLLGDESISVKRYTVEN